MVCNVVNPSNVLYRYLLFYNTNQHGALANISINLNETASLASDIYFEEQLERAIIKEYKTHIFSFAGCCVFTDTYF